MNPRRWETFQIVALKCGKWWKTTGFLCNLRCFFHVPFILLSFPLISFHCPFMRSWKHGIGWYRHNQNTKSHKVAGNAKPTKKSKNWKKTNLLDTSWTQHCLEVACAQLGRSFHWNRSTLTTQSIILLWYDSRFSFHRSSMFIQFHVISPASSHRTSAETKGDLPPMRLLSMSCCRQQGDTAQLAPRRGSAAQNSRDLRPAKASGF